MIQSLKKDIAKLSVLVDGWDEEVNALERDLFLDVLRRMYDKVRFEQNNVQPTQQIASPAEPQPMAEESAESSVIETIAAFATMGAATQTDAEPECEIELVMENGDVIPVSDSATSGEDGDEPDFEVELVMNEEEDKEEEECDDVVAPAPDEQALDEQPAEECVEQPTPAGEPAIEVQPLAEESKFEEVVSEPAPATYTRPKISRQVIDTLYGDGALPKVSQPMAQPVAEAATPQQVVSQPTPQPVAQPQTVPAPQQPAAPSVQPTISSVEPSVADVVAPKTVLGDVINSGAVRLGDSLQGNSGLDVATKIAAGEVRTLRGAMGLNDKIMIMRDLFGGDAAMFDTVMAELDEQPSLDDALIYISGYAWNSTSEGAKMLMNLLKLKYS